MNKTNQWFLFFGLIVMSIVPPCLAQDVPDSLYEDYEWRITQPYLYNVYIPANEKEAWRELKRLAEKEGLNKFRYAPEDSIRRRLHFGLGKWMMRNWQIFQGSRISKYVMDLGILHPDDIVEYLIVSMHRIANAQPIQTQNLVEELNAERKVLYEKARNRVKPIERDTLPIESVHDSLD